MDLDSTQRLGYVRGVCVYTDRVQRLALSAWLLPAILFLHLSAALANYDPPAALVGLAVAWPMSTLPRCRWIASAAFLLALDAIAAHVAGEHYAGRAWWPCGDSWSLAGYLMGIGIVAALGDVVATLSGAAGLRVAELGKLEARH